MKIGLRYQIYSLFSRGLAERESSLFFVFFRRNCLVCDRWEAVVFFFKNRMFLLHSVVNIYEACACFVLRLSSRNSRVADRVDTVGNREVRSGKAFFFLLPATRFGVAVTE